MSHDNQTSADQADYADHAIWRLVGARITAFAGNEAGEICIETDRGGRFVIGKDLAGDISLFEIETVPAGPENAV